jgi:hypothetical protein
VRTQTKVLLACLAAICLLVIGSLMYLDRWFRPELTAAALPSLVRDLPRQTAEIEPVFQRRVRAQYPDGLAAEALADDLRRKGFYVPKAAKSEIVVAALTQPDPVCAHTWIIYWTPDNQGRARQIGAHFNLGCL